MGKFKAMDGIVIRKLENVTIIFYDARTIYVFPTKGFGSIFHRWFYIERGSYINGWKDFRRLLMREKNLTLLHCHELAGIHNIASISTNRWPDLKEDEVCFKD